MQSVLNGLRLYPLKRRFAPIIINREIYRTVSNRRRAMTESTTNPLTGLWMPNQISHLYYGPGSVNKHLLSALPSETSKAFIITGNSLATKSPLIKQVESLLGSKRHAGTFSNISQHAPVAEIDKATNAVREDSAIDTIISIGGGSPIDSAKAISYRVHEKTGSFLHHVTIPTTLSAAECTFFAGYTTEEGVKSLVKDFALVPKVIIYDADFVVGYSPVHLYLSTGIRAVDHGKPPSQPAPPISLHLSEPN